MGKQEQIIFSVDDKIEGNFTVRIACTSLLLDLCNSGGGGSSSSSRGGGGGSRGVTAAE